MACFIVWGQYLVLVCLSVSLILHSLTASENLRYSAPFISCTSITYSSVMCSSIEIPLLVNSHHAFVYIIFVLHDHLFL